MLLMLLLPPPPSSPAIISAKVEAVGTPKEEVQLPRAREYLWTLESLYAVSLVDLGAMDSKSYESFQREMRLFADEKGISNPIMVIDIKLKEPNDLGTQEQPYPISEEEFPIFMRDAKTMAVSMPHVHIVD